MENQEKIPKFMQKILIRYMLLVLFCTVVIFLMLILVKVKQFITYQQTSVSFSSPVIANDFASSPIPTPTIKPSPLPEVADSKILSGGIHTFQTFNNCGPASLSMALSYFGISKSQAELGKQLRPYQNSIGDNDDKSVTLSELASKGEELGLISIHRPAGNMDLVKHFVNNDMPVITRTWLKVDDTIGHYRVIKGFDHTRNIIIQDDSLQGKDLEYSYDEFNKLWQAFNYEFLVLVPSDKVELANKILTEFELDSNPWQVALNLSNTQLQDNPNDIYSQFNKSVALYHLNRFEESVEAFESIESKLPFRMLWYQIEPIKAYYQIGNYDKVLGMTNEILNNHNRAFSELHYIQGKVYGKLGQTQLAQEAFERAEIYNSNSKIWHVNIMDLN